MAGGRQSLGPKGFLTEEEKYERAAKKQLDFMAAKAENYPAGYAMFLIALQEYFEWSDKVTVVRNGADELDDLPCRVSLDTVVRILDEPTEEYPVKNGKTTFYVCKGRSCKPPVNNL